MALPPIADATSDPAPGPHPDGSSTSPPAPPVAKIVPTTRSFHGDDVLDPYGWMRAPDDPGLVAYLEAENAYTAAMTAGTVALQRQIFDEIKERTLETDLSVPFAKGDWWYYVRTVEGAQYPVHCRSRTEPLLPDPRTAPESAAPSDGPAAPDEVVLLDQNELAGESPYFALGEFDVSPDGHLLAYSTDYDGSEKFTLRVKDLRTGELLPDEITGTYYGTGWARDGGTIFYSTVDAAMRPFRIWRHTLGAAQADDVLVHEELDERFFAGVGLLRSEDFLILELGSKITTEAWVLSSDNPTGDWRVIAPRRQGVEYAVTHSGDWFWILHNDGAVNFELARTRVGSVGTGGTVGTASAVVVGEEAEAHSPWETVIPERADTRLTRAAGFADHLAIAFRRGGATAVRVLPLADGEPGEAYEIEFPEEVRLVGLGSNADFHANTVRLTYMSLTTPGSVYDHDLATRELTLRRQQPVLGGVDLDAYESVREWATALDGTRVPISLVRHKDTPRDGTAPALLYGYGSYEISMDPWFSIARLSLLDRGFVFAIAHIRGGGELGRMWYEDGKLLAKRNTFTDFVACADALVERQWTSYERLVARGGSAGGLLMGAVGNLAPERFAAIVAEVPFVDALTTILDPSLPLTVIEWEEWGNPVESPEVYEYMKSYSPYENVRAQAYPSILATAGLNDPRVGVHEPAKWVARLRALKTDDRPLLLKTEMGAGHAGPSGRYDAWRDEAFVLAFAIETVGRRGARHADGGESPSA